MAAEIKQLFDSTSDIRGMLENKIGAAFTSSGSPDGGKQTRKGSRTCTYWMASWRDSDKTRNVHLGSARQKAGKMKAEALGMRA